MAEKLNVARQTPNLVGFVARSDGKWLNKTTLTLDATRTGAATDYVIIGTRVGTSPLVEADFPSGSPGSKKNPRRYDILPVEAVGGSFSESSPAAGGMFQIKWSGTEIVDGPSEETPAATTWPVSVASFKSTFERDFPFGTGRDSVRNTDITRALNDARLIFNERIWKDDAQRADAYLWAAAHCLWENINMSGGLSAFGKGKGLSRGGNGLIQQKSVGGMSASYAIPDRFKNDPLFNRLVQSPYGSRYAMLLAPRRIANVQTAAGFSEFDEYPS